MKVLVCGAGKISEELLKRLGENWQVTLIDKVDQKLSEFLKRFTSIIRTVVGDASSPVVLEDAFISEQDYVLALTDNDRVNLATVTFARENGVKNILSLVRDAQAATRFQSLQIHTVLFDDLISRRIYHYLQNPRINVRSLGSGEVEVIEAVVGPGFPVSGRTLAPHHDRLWRIVGYLRNGYLLYPDTETIYLEGDRLIFLSKPGLFDEVSQMIEDHTPHFPMGYGKDLVIGLPRLDEAHQAALIKESIHVARFTKIQSLQVLYEGKNPDIQDQLAPLTRDVDVQFHQEDEKLSRQVRQVCSEQSIGLVIVPPVESSFFKSLKTAAHIDLAHSLPCPLLVAKQTIPYESILVPFSGSEKTIIALEIAMDIALQMGAEITVVVVEQPEFLHTNTGKTEDPVEKLFEHVREIAHVYKIKVREVIRRGNPVQEITDLAKDFNLMVIGSTNRNTDLFSPNVGELLVKKSKCSVLIIA